MELAVARIGTGGDGVAWLPDGAPAFVAGALPGERVRARLLGRRGDGQAARIDAILTPSPDRVAPPCPLFLAGCGGCALQHWADAPYAAWKRDRVAEALERAGFPDPSIVETVRTPLKARRRADLALRRGADGATMVGFHERSNAAAVLDLTICHILDPRLFALLDPLRAALRRLAALKREGSAALNLLDTGPDLLLRTDAPLTPTDRAALAAFGQANGIPRIAHARGDRAAPETAAQLSPATIRFANIEVAPPPGAFLQASPQGEAAIIEAVLAGLPEKLPARARIADLYAGIGTLTFPLATRARIAAFEGGADALAALDAAARRANTRVEAQRRDLARQPLTPVELASFAALVLDPPFAGATAQAEQIARAGDAAPPRVIYVSCNPAALARDARALHRAGYALLGATPIDQFLWSTQIEAVAVFARPARGRRG